MRAVRARGSNELRDWQGVFARCATIAREAGRQVALDAVSDEVDALAHHMPTKQRNRREIDIVRLIEAHHALGFLDGFDERMSGAQLWRFTRALVVEPLLPEARERIRREFAEGFYESLDLELVEEVGRC